MKFHNPSHWLHSPWNCQGWAMRIWKSLGSAICPEIKNLGESHTFCTFCILWEKKIVICNLLDFIYKNCPFLVNFDKSLFLLLWLTHLNKNSPRLNAKLIFAHFLFTCVNHMSKNRFLSKLLKNGQFLVNKVNKITKDELFFKIYKMCRMYDFHINFQFWGKTALPRDFQMGMAHPWQFLGLWSQWDGSGNFMDGFWESL